MLSAGEAYSESYRFNTALSASATEDSTLHTVTFLDFDGNIIDTLEVADGEEIDYSAIDTSQLSMHLDKYTQVRFYAWDQNPQTADKDLTIQALSQTGIIDLISAPSRTEFYSNEGNVDLSGLDVTITFITQTAEIDDDGNRVTVQQTVDITESCYASPSDLSELFAEGDTASVSVYPRNSNVALVSYDVTFMDNLGDVNSDGKINAVDASLVLTHYAAVSTGQAPDLTEEQLNYADASRDGKVNAIDASRILTYYALEATGQNANWEEILYG